MLAWVQESTLSEGEGSMQVMRQFGEGEEHKAWRAGEEADSVPFQQEWEEEWEHGELSSTQ